MINKKNDDFSRSPGGIDFRHRKGENTMSRPQSKPDLLTAAAQNYEALNAFIESMTDKELETPFDFTKMKAKSEAHWARDKNLRDVLIHLYEWHRLLIDWVKANQKDGEQEAHSGEKQVIPFLPAPYNWRTFGAMNVEFWKKHQCTSLEEAGKMLEESHREVMSLAENFTNEELFNRGAFPWVGNNALGSYFVSNTSSHYDWALKKLKAHRKNCKQL